jgi:hypothetical protein
VQEASNAIARLRGHPEVGAARVEDNLECLGRSANGNLGEVWELRLAIKIQLVVFMPDLH